jgi:hypothetical protein
LTGVAVTFIAAIFFEQVLSVFDVPGDLLRARYLSRCDSHNHQAHERTSPVISTAGEGCLHQVWGRLFAGEPVSRPAFSGAKTIRQDSQLADMHVGPTRLGAKQTTWTVHWFLHRYFLSAAV